MLAGWQLGKRLPEIGVACGHRDVDTLFERLLAAQSKGATDELHTKAAVKALFSFAAAAGEQSKARAHKLHSLKAAARKQQV